MYRNAGDETEEEDIFLDRCFNAYTRDCSRKSISIFCFIPCCKCSRSKSYQTEKVFLLVLSGDSQWPRMFSMNMRFRNVKRCIPRVMFLKSDIICTVEILKKRMYCTVVGVDSQ